MLRPGRFALPASVRTFTLELSLPLSPSEASSMTTRVNSQFPRLDSHQLDTQHYGLRAKQSQRCWSGGLTHWKITFKANFRQCSSLLVSSGEKAHDRCRQPDITQCPLSAWVGALASLGMFPPPP